MMPGQEHGRANCLERIRSLVKRGRYRLSIHAEKERDDDKITIFEVEEALG